MKDEFPSIAELMEALQAVKEDAVLEKTEIDVRLQVVPGEGWRLWTGDPKYDTDHRGWWGASTISKSSGRRAVACDLVEQAREDQARSGWAPARGRR